MTFITKQHAASRVLALTVAYFILRVVMPIHTFAHVMSGVGIPLARQGRGMGMPSIVLNTWGPCWMVGITGNKKKWRHINIFLKYLQNLVVVQMHFSLLLHVSQRHLEKACALLNTQHSRWILLLFYSSLSCPFPHSFTICLVFVFCYEGICRKDQPLDAWRIFLEMKNVISLNN